MAYRQMQELECWLAVCKDCCTRRLQARVTPAYRNGVQIWPAYTENVTGSFEVTQVFNLPYTIGQESFIMAGANAARTPSACQKKHKNAVKRTLQHEMRCQMHSGCREKLVTLMNCRTESLKWPFHSAHCPP